MEFDNINKVLYMSMLFDFYSELLTNKQKYVFEMYFLENYNMQEIAEELKISRQAVNETLKKTQIILTNYEAKLNLIKNYYNNIASFKKINLLLDYCLELDNNINNNEIKEKISDAKNIIKNLINE